MNGDVVTGVGRRGPRARKGGNLAVGLLIGSQIAVICLGAWPLFAAILVAAGYSTRAGSAFDYGWFFGCVGEWAVVTSLPGWVYLAVFRSSWVAYLTKSLPGLFLLFSAVGSCVALLIGHLDR